MTQQNYSPWWSLPVLVAGVVALTAWVYIAGCAVEYFSGEGRLFMTQEMRLVGGVVALAIMAYTACATIAVAVGAYPTEDKRPRCGCRPKPPQGSGVPIKPEPPQAKHEP